MVYVNAAHPPPLIVRDGAERVELEATAMPVGMIEDAAFPTSEVQLTPGDKVLIYSDGVSEAQDTQGNFFGRKRLLDAVAACATGNCNAIHAAVQEAVAAFTEGAPQSDDITFVVLEFHGKSTPPTMF